MKVKKGCNVHCKPIQFFVFAVVSTAPTEPRNLKVVNQSSSSVFLSWTQPVIANGIIRYYTIKYGLKQDKMVQSTKVKGYLLQSRVQPLEEFSTYYFLVHAETQITGKSSQIVSAKTLEDGK